MPTKVPKCEGPLDNNMLSLGEECELIVKDPYRWRPARLHVYYVLYHSATRGSMVLCDWPLDPQHWWLCLWCLGEDDEYVTFNRLTSEAALVIMQEAREGRGEAAFMEGTQTL